MPLLRPRISLLTALLLMTIVGLAITVVQLWREGGLMRAQLRQLRDETGRLSIDDPSKVSAIEVRTNEPHSWKWRVWVPEDELIYVHLKWGDVPRAEVPTEKTMLGLTPGEQWVTLKAQRDPADNSWNLVFESEGQSVTKPISEQDCWWLGRPTAMSAEGVNFSAATDEQDGKPFILKRFRTSKTTNNSSVLMKDDNPTQGFMIWLDHK